MFDSLSYSSLTYKKDLSFSIYSNQYFQSKIDSTELGIKAPLSEHLLRNEYSSFWKKAGRGELLIGGIEIICMGTLMLMPKEVTKWQPGWIKAAKRMLHGHFHHFRFGITMIGQSIISVIRSPDLSTIML